MRSYPILPPAWPPPDGAYDYILHLNDAELAWEFLRRNTDYQQHVERHRATLADPVVLASGQQLWRCSAPSLAARRWGLYPFCRSGFAGSRRAFSLVARFWRGRT